jgi:hypothetical protein
VTNEAGAASAAVAREAVALNLADAAAVCIRVSGRCMEPALLAGELVELRRTRPRVGDVVLAQLPQGLRLHRLLLKLPLGAGWRTKGDRSDPWDARIGSGDVLATVVRSCATGRSPRSRGLALRSLASALRWRLRVHRIKPEGQ